MIRKIVVTTAALVLLATPLSFAAEPTGTAMKPSPGAVDLGNLTDVRVSLIKAALQLTPDQQKLWPPIEDAMRARIKNRQARWEKLADLRDNSLSGIQAQNAVQLLQHRAESLSQRGADLKKLADAWDPLYKTLTDDQKQRMAFVTVVVARGIRDSIEYHLDPEDFDD